MYYKYADDVEDTLQISSIFYLITSLILRDKLQGYFYKFYLDTIRIESKTIHIQR